VVSAPETSLIRLAISIYYQRVTGGQTQGHG